MTHELQGPGNGSPRLRFDRTQVVLDRPGHRSVIPLDQITHVERGKQGASPAFLAFPFIGIALATWGYLYGPPADGSFWWFYVGLGAALAILGVVAFLLLSTLVVRVGSSGGQMVLEIGKDQIREAAVFIRDLMHARTEFLEGVYEAEEF